MSKRRSQPKLKPVFLNRVLLGKARTWQEVSDLVHDFSERLFSNLHWNAELEGFEIRRRCRTSLMTAFGIAHRGRVFTPETCGEDDSGFYVFLPSNPQLAAETLMGPSLSLAQISGLEVDWDRIRNLPAGEEA